MCLANGRACGPGAACKAWACGPRAQRESSTDSSQLFERSERSERSEFCDGAARPSSAGKSKRSVDRTGEALQPARHAPLPPRLLPPSKADFQRAAMRRKVPKAPAGKT